MLTSLAMTIQVCNVNSCLIVCPQCFM